MRDDTDEPEDLRAAVAEGLAQSLRGESAPIDFVELKKRLRADLARPAADDSAC